MDGGCLLDDLRTFGINADQRTIAAQDEGGWRKTAEQRAERFMAKWIAAEEIGDGLRHAEVCPNMTGRTKEMMAQSKRALARSLAGGPNLYPPGVFVCRCPTAFLWRYVFSFLFCFRIFAFIEPAALRPIVLRYACAPMATRS